MDAKFTVYKGEQAGRLVYIGTTTQEPAARFRWHKANGKPLDFTVLNQFDTAEEMLDEEFRLITKHRPKLNTIKHRKQNLNVKLTPQVLAERKDDPQWCQCCMRRRVNAGYSTCYRCPTKEPTK